MNPPKYVIEAARLAAMKSPCAKSKRGAALFNRELADRVFRVIADAPFDTGLIAAVGFNGQPLPFSCSGSDLCRRDCGKLCLHAEERAIRAAGALDDVADLELVHVKVVADQVVADGGPSCWQCSRLVVEVKLRGVWLFEHAACPSDQCPMCTGDKCMICDADPWPQVDRRYVRTVEEAQGVMKPFCQHDGNDRHRGLGGRWKFYGAEQFHAETLRNEVIGDPR